MSPINDLNASAELGQMLPTRVLTRGGAQLDPRLDVWEWTDGVFKLRIDFSYYKGGYERHVPSLKLALVPYLKGHSSSHVVNLERAYRFLVESSGPCLEREFLPTHLSNFMAALGPNEQWRVGTLNGLIQRWVALGLPGMHSECATYLAQRRKPGNKKGEAVATRDPFKGPFSELEYTALHSAVNAAYGRGDIPLWPVILSRLLLACGGRISQYASLKILDFDTDTRVLQLPQAKSRQEHSRVQFLEFDIGSQTSGLLAKYVNELHAAGFPEVAPLFPEDLVMARKAAKQLRAPEDLFFGHCDAATLSRRYQRSIEDVAPPTPRLDFAPMPLNPQRFRYTYGTRNVEEGASKAVLANRLGHVDLQHVDVYYSASPKVVENIDKAIGVQLAPLARAFQGTLVEDETSSTQKGALGSRIIDFRVSTDPVGGCSQCARDCSFSKPVGCYTCFRFEPFLDAPHEALLQLLLRERERWIDDERMAAINDESIRAVEEVIALCRQVREERAFGEEAST